MLLGIQNERNHLLTVNHSYIYVADPFAEDGYW